LVRHLELLLPAMVLLQHPPVAALLVPHVSLLQLHLVSPQLIDCWTIDGRVLLIVLARDIRWAWVMRLVWPLPALPARLLVILLLVLPLLLMLLEVWLPWPSASRQSGGCRHLWPFKRRLIVRLAAGKPVHCMLELLLLHWIQLLLLPLSLLSLLPPLLLMLLLLLLPLLRRWLLPLLRWLLPLLRWRLPLLQLLLLLRLRLRTVALLLQPFERRRLGLQFHSLGLARGQLLLQLQRPQLAVGTADQWAEAWVRTPNHLDL